MNFWERDSAGYGANTHETHSPTNAGAHNAYGAVETDWQSKIGEYMGKSQDEMMQELLQTADRMKGDGSLNAQSLDDFYSRVSGFLNEEQRARMRALIEMLKR